MKRSAGILLFRRIQPTVEVFLVHPGGPLWVKKDAGAWSIPKGEYSEDEDPLLAARREFEEETGFGATGEFLPLGEVEQPGRKRVIVWACEGDIDPSQTRSNMFQLEWPPRSGKLREFPEVDRAAWFTIETAREKLLKGQQPFLERLVQLFESG